MASAIDDALAELERTNPAVRRARERVDEATRQIPIAGQRQQEVDAAKLAAVLGLVHKAYLAMDAAGMDALLVSVTFRGYRLTESEMLAQLASCPPEVVAWWQQPCDAC